MPAFAIGDRWVGDDHPTYFIADISANHDGDLGRACELIHLAAQAGANAAKFQNFRASEIVSDFGFRSLRSQVSHQARWTRSVYEVYQNASIPWEWTPKLRDECDAACIDYFSTPYDLGAVDMLDRHVRVYKVGSGDITWPELMRAVAAKKKPVLLAAGASEIGEVQRAVDEILAVNSQLALLQCNTNYTVSLENFRYINLNVLKSFRAMFPNVVLGLSDHTPGHTTVLGAVALGARIVEKHFTDDTRREGPDHAFSMTPQTWREMVDRTRELELALGDPGKRVEENERETVVIQRRCVRAAKELRSGTTLTHELLTLVRPAPLDGIFPFDAERIIGRRLCCDLPAGEYLRWTMLEAD